jgi:flagellar biosynthesis protein FlhA
MAAPTAPKPAGLLSVATGESILPLALVGIVVIMVVPLPAAMIDVLLALSIAIALIILMVGLYLREPLEFSTFPSVLLVVTLFRLSLNVASTRAILLYGSEGPGAAGHVIQAFGRFVVGGNYVVGLVIFLILVVINFSVITKGAGRIAEVAARFTLDAMPGKQLAIDADLNSGLINEQEARKRRRTIESEADFYGAMDGASKFVRGDAVAGLAITAINIIGGFFIGVVQQGVQWQEAAQTYTMLSIGDGLVSQLPALLISTAAGIIVTRAASGADLGTDVGGQLLDSPRVLWMVSGILGAFALVPGLPFMPFIVLAGATAALATNATTLLAPALTASGEPVVAARMDDRPETLLPLDLMELEVGFELVSLVDGSGNEGGDMVDRIRTVRRQLALEMGFIVPPVHIRDNLQLKANTYVVLLKGNEVARGEVRAGCYLAVCAGTPTSSVPGVATVEPAFGMDALWVSAQDRERAQLAGYTVVDGATAIITHLTEVIRRHANELLGRQEVQQLLDALAKSRPKVVEELVPQQLSVGGVQKVLQQLLREGVSIRDLSTILETLADVAPRTKDPDALTDAVREALGRQITKHLTSPDNEVAIMTLAAPVERSLLDAVRRDESGAALALEPGLARVLVERLREWIGVFQGHQRPPVLLCSATLRGPLRRFLERYLPALAIISPQEIASSVRIKSIGTVTLNET